MITLIKSPQILQTLRQIFLDSWCFWFQPRIGHCIPYYHSIQMNVSNNTDQRRELFQTLPCRVRTVQHCQNVERLVSDFAWWMLLMMMMIMFMQVDFFFFFFFFLIGKR